ncbi:MAG: TraR/DksA C4-type zinc finger protein [Rhodocyclales bacterium]|nr:TraR/DksA C4-type zinc finger protein [Rhodocyclales bacterium]
MTDFADRAVEHEEEMLGDALEKQRRNNPMNGKTVADSATHCGGCGQQISEARRQAVPGCQLCFDCQGEANWLEARRKGWPR